MAVNLNKSKLDELFPARVVTDANGLISAIGPSVKAHCPDDIIGLAIVAAFDVLCPQGVKSVERLLEDERVVMLRLVSDDRFMVRGVIHREGDEFHFLLGHVVNEASEGQIRYSLSDFSPFDGAREVFIASKIRKALLRDAHELASRLKREKRVAEEASASKSQFLACMSHEIRTPLNGVLGLTALLEQTELDERQTELLRGVSGCGMHLLAMLNDLIDTSKMDTEQMTLESEPFQMADLASRLRTTFAPTFRDKGVAFEVEVDPGVDCPTLIGDAARINQVLTNLVSNAQRFTETGYVAVNIAARASGDEGWRELEISVRDTGIGIEEEHQRRVFEPFMQADAGTTRKFGGTGLGLSICRRLCRMMNGEIFVESEIGVGSAFRATMKLKAAEADSETASATVRAAS